MFVSRKERILDGQLSREHEKYYTELVLKFSPKSAEAFAHR